MQGLGFRVPAADQRRAVHMRHGCFDERFWRLLDGHGDSLRVGLVLDLDQ